MQTRMRPTFRFGFSVEIKKCAPEKPQDGAEVSRVDSLLAGQFPAREAFGLVVGLHLADERNGLFV